MRNSAPSPLLGLVLALFLAACTVAPPASPTPEQGLTPTPSAASPNGSPTVGPGLTSPTATESPSPTPTLTPAAPSPSPTATPTTTPTASPSAPGEEVFARLQRILENERDSLRMLGLGAAVLFPDGTLWTGGAGFANVEQRTPATGETPFVVGSISKTFVTAAILQLVDERVLTLDDPLSRWLPDYPNAGEITLRQLLSHTSGVFNYFEHPSYPRLVFGSPRREWTADEIISTFDARPYFAPGTGYHYSNTGFVLLGMVVEAATGNTVGEEYRARFFEPLGLADTYFQGDGPPATETAHGYLVGADGPRRISDGTDYRPTTSAATVAWTAGAVASSAADLATWSRALYGGILVEPASVAEMTDFGANPYALGRYGLGTRTRLVDGRRGVGHTGSLRGYASVMWYFPAEGISVVVLSNRGRVDATPIGDRLAMAAFRALGYEAP